MTPLMRDTLKRIFPSVKDAHAGLLIQRGLSVWEEDSEKPAKKKLMDTICKVNPSELYLLAFNRWLDNTYETGHDNIATVAAKVEGRLFTGLSLGGTLETGAITQHTYGMPMLAGSSIKGAVRNYTEHLFAKLDDEGDLQFKEVNHVHKIIIQEDKQQVLDILFGADDDASDGDDDNSSQSNNANAGYLIWHDAWWIPHIDSSGKLLTGDQYKPFVGDIITVHHPEYYHRKLDQALDMENPVPNQQLAIQGGFYFAIQGEQKWVDLAKKLLQQTIQNTGLGAKATSGYGYFSLDDDLNQEMARRYEMSKPIDTTADPLAEIRQVVKYMDEAQLIEGLSKGKTAFFKQLALNKDDNEDIAKVVKVVLEEHADLVNSWEGESAKNTQRAYKFVTANQPT